MKKAPTLEKTQNDLQGVAVFSDGVGSEDVGVACERLRVACERLKNTRHVSLKERLGEAALFFASGTLAIVDAESVDAASIDGTCCDTRNTFIYWLDHFFRLRFLTQRTHHLEFHPCIR